jgi:hypothetical protein
MSDETDLAEALERRTEAWSRMNGTVARLREGLAERPITARLKDHAADRVLDAVDTAKAAMMSNRGVIGGVVVALAGWMFRRRLVRAAKGWADGWHKPADKETP